jgi:hypothetical protein
MSRKLVNVASRMMDRMSLLVRKRRYDVVRCDGAHFQADHRRALSMTYGCFERREP